MKILALLLALTTAGVWLENGSLTIDVDSTLSTLLVVTVTGSWNVGTEPGALTLRTEIYNP